MWPAYLAYCSELGAQRQGVLALFLPHDKAAVCIPFDDAAQGVEFRIPVNSPCKKNLQLNQLAVQPCQYD